MATSEHFLDSFLTLLHHSMIEWWGLKKSSVTLRRTDAPISMLCGSGWISQQHPAVFPFYILPQSPKWNPLIILPNNLHQAQFKTSPLKQRASFLLKMERQAMLSPEHNNCIMELHSTCVDVFVLEFLKRWVCKTVLRISRCPFSHCYSTKKGPPCA